MTVYLVTGAAGFLGFYIAQQLAKSPENQVVCVDNFIRGQRDEHYAKLIAKDNVVEFELDLNSLEACSKLPENVDYVFHMAALNGTQNFYSQPFEVVRCCTLPTLHLLEKYGQTGKLKRFIYAGTSEAYASTVTNFNWPVPTAENVPLSFDDVMNERWSYGASKMHGEIATVNAGRHFNMPYSIVRFHNAYGPRMGDKHVVPDFLMRAAAGRYELFGHEDTRSFIYATDAADATIAVAFAEGAENQVVNVGSEDEILIRDLGYAMMKAAGLEGEIKLHPSPKGSVKHRAPDIGKLRSLTDYEPKWTLQEGLAVTARYYLGGGVML